ncbi:MAG: hypothetical protein Q9171_002876 [Xanthocarpia ochracea]
MASPITLSLEERFARQLQVRSDENSQDGATDDTLPPNLAVISRSRRMELAPHNVRIRHYLKEHDALFRQLDELKEKGWNTAEGDYHFRKQREAADTKDDEQEHIFHRVHLAIGNELCLSGAFNVKGLEGSKVNALNLCMAPGAYTAAILKQYPDASVCGITLPVESGGHKMIIPYGPKDPRVDLRFLDITMLICELWVRPFSIPDRHPDAANFIKSSLFHGHEFDLVLCDGQALRTHERAKYREDTREARRLLAAQLVFGMTRIKQGGTFVILLHKADAWDTMRLLQNFCSFSQVALFKPETGHRSRSTFYLVAKDVQSTSTQARLFVDHWKQTWTEATFGGEEGVGTDPAMPDDTEVDALLHDFGSRLIHLAQNIWLIQAAALNRAHWISGSGAAKTRQSPSIQTPVFSEHGEPSTPRFSRSVLCTRSRWPPSSTNSPGARDPLLPTPPLTSRSGNQPRYLRSDVDEDKVKKMAGSWR